MTENTTKTTTQTGPAIGSWLRTCEHGSAAMGPYLAGPYQVHSHNEEGLPKILLTPTWGNPRTLVVRSWVRAATVC